MLCLCTCYQWSQSCALYSTTAVHTAVRHVNHVMQQVMSLALTVALTVAGTWLPWLLMPAAVLLAFSGKDALFNAAAGTISKFSPGFK